MTVTRAWPFGSYFDAIRANYARSGTVPPSLAASAPLTARQVGREGWAGFIVESFFRETSEPDAVANGQAVVDALVAAASPYVGQSLGSLPKTLTATVTGTRASANDTLAENVDEWARPLIDRLAELAAGGAVLVAILAVLLLGLVFLFRGTR